MIHRSITLGQRKKQFYSTSIDIDRSTPKELVILGRENKKQLEDRIEDRITKMESERKSPGYVKGVHKSVKSWPVHNGVDRSQT